MGDADAAGLGADDHMTQVLAPAVICRLGNGDPQRQLLQTVQARLHNLLCRHESAFLFNVSKFMELVTFIVQRIKTLSVCIFWTMDGTEKIMASLKMGFVSSLFVDVFFLLIFLPSCSRYTLTNGSDKDN